jgi:hypothetical protein
VNRTGSTPAIWALSIDSKKGMASRKISPSRRVVFRSFGWNEPVSP